MILHFFLTNWLTYGHIFVVINLLSQLKTIRLLIWRLFYNLLTVSPHLLIVKLLGPGLDQWLLKALFGLTFNFWQIRAKELRGWLLGSWMKMWGSTRRDPFSSHSLTSADRKISRIFSPNAPVGSRENQFQSPLWWVGCGVH